MKIKRKDICALCILQDSNYILNIFLFKNFLLKGKVGVTYISLFSMFKPLSLEVWIAIFVSLITGIVSQSELSFLTFGLIFIVVIIFGLTIKMNTGKNNALSISLWLCIDALLGQGLDEPPR